MRIMQAFVGTGLFPQKIKIKALPKTGNAFLNEGASLTPGTDLSKWAACFRT
ncbi:hypothetical protein l13_09030 [Neisseria weaveri ATCC 51223]|nr:hypothetical protein l13_09030 [Neisseria weaveri ATCC 51223]